MSSIYQKDRAHLIKIDTKTGKKTYQSTWENEKKLKNAVFGMNINAKVTAERIRSGKLKPREGIQIHTREDSEYKNWKPRSYHFMSLKK